ncbi:MAG TPA: DoxX family protein [Acidimicrobiales bacterium]|jgi:putative oxidoreductase|nr:DoxX family protein [Acidimicrobiales bacterium]
MSDLDALNLGLLILRVVIGLTLAAHGYNKFFGGGRIPGTAAWFDSMGMRPGKLQAVMAASMEMISGILLAVGLLTPFAGAGFVGLMCVAYYTVHRPNGFFIVKSGYEYNVILATIGVALAVTGAGQWSLDDKLGIWTSLNGWPGLLIAVVGGVGGAVALLAACYRPPAKSTD